MRIIVNANDLEVAEGTSLLSLLERLGRSSAHVAVEHNGEIIDRSDFANVQLRAEDRLELVHFVGGG